MLSVAQGLNRAGANQYSFLERRGAHIASGAVLGAGNTNVRRPASAFEEVSRQQRGEAWTKRPSMVERGGQLCGGTSQRGVSQMG